MLVRIAAWAASENSASSSVSVATPVAAAAVSASGIVAPEAWAKLSSSAWNGAPLTSAARI